MSTDNTIVIADCDPFGLKAEMQAQYEAAAGSGDTMPDGTDALTVSPSVAGTPVAPSYNDLLQDWPLPTVAEQ